MGLFGLQLEGLEFIRGKLHPVHSVPEDLEEIRSCGAASRLPWGRCFRPLVPLLWLLLQTFAFSQDLLAPPCHF